MSASAAGFAPFNPMLVESDFQLRAAVDSLKWQLGQPLPPPPLSLSDCAPLGLPRPYYCYDDYYCYGDPYYMNRLDRLHYSQGYRDGLAAFARGDRTDKATAADATPSRPASAAQSASSASGGAKKMSAAAGYPGDLMEFPSASYRRPVGPVPVSNCTSYDDLTAGWPYGCKPFYFRRADPPSVRYC
ncbi:hypothetical protein BOX15_Mlig026072g2 [Macrostomum lignano]|uniref:Uncharacterized protein n=1 Tax=Macrostomum lignano TaxID=282301 RepID=A0A267DYP6_9PLAT|nr:hypothetical protein BOX15_Mlig026072g1 [Macrostomum lignano]PAA83766.1 hypothetical protein BOX15_Mlig026072g2 [Macrostomum lignano]